MAETPNGGNLMPIKEMPEVDKFRIRDSGVVHVAFELCGPILALTMLDGPLKGKKYEIEWEQEE